MTAEQFQHEIFECALNSPICDIPIVRRITATSVNLRIPLTFGHFVDIFYNEETGTTAYALIEKGKRIFGADNTGGWHLHSFENPISLYACLFKQTFSRSPRRSTGVSRIF